MPGTGSDYNHLRSILNLTCTWEPAVAADAPVALQEFCANCKGKSTKQLHFNFAKRSNISSFEKADSTFFKTISRAMGFLAMHPLVLFCVITCYLYFIQSRNSFIHVCPF